MTNAIENKLYEELEENIEYLCSFEEEGQKEEAIENLKIIYYTNDVNELNERYNLSLNKIEDYVYDSSHFNEGGWYISEDGYFVRCYALLNVCERQYVLCLASF